MHERNRREPLPFGLFLESTVADLQETLTRRLDSFRGIPGAMQTGNRWKGHIAIPFDHNRQRLVLPYKSGDSTAIHVNFYVDNLDYRQITKRTYINFSWPEREDENFCLGQVLEDGHDEYYRRPLSYPIRTIREMRIKSRNHLIEALSALQDM